MKKLVLAASLLAALSANHAWAYNRVLLTGGYELNYTDGRSHEFDAHIYNERTQAGDAPTSAEAHSVDAAEAFWGVKHDTSASITQSTASTSITAETQAPASPALKISEFGLQTSAVHSAYDRRVEHTSRYRFIVDYDLYASGVDTRASLSFRADEGYYASPENQFQIGFSKTIYGDDGPASFKGSWASDWVYFKTVDGSPNAASFDLSVLTGSSIAREYNPILNPGTASWQVYANASWRYEIEPWDGVAAPVPEPETYALMAVGIAGAFTARRLKLRRSA